VVREQVQGFDESGRGQESLTNWLGPTVNVLYRFSETIGGVVSLVRLRNSTAFLQGLLSDTNVPGVSTNRSDLYWNRVPSLGECPPYFSFRALSLRSSPLGGAGC
jgi:hypothetical protein